MENLEDQGDAKGVASEKESAPSEKFESYLDILGAIATLQRQHTEVQATYTTLNIAGYGPREWQFSLSEKVDSRFDVITIGPEKHPYIVRAPLVGSSFDSLDTFITSQLEHIDWMINRIYTLIREPSSVTINGEIVCEPEALGFPMDKLLASQLPPENIHAVISPFCRAERSFNSNFSLVSVFDGIDLEGVRNDVLALHRNVMPNLRGIFEEMLTHVLNGKVPEKAPAPINNSVILSAVSNPVMLNNMFSHIPRRVQLTTHLIAETQVPEIMLNPLPPAQLLSLGSQAATRISCINAMANVSFDPSMNAEVSAWILSLIVPGSVLFTVSFDDLSSDDPYSRGLAALGAKLLLSHHREARWNSVTANTIHSVEAALVHMGTEAGILEPAAHPGDDPLSRVAAVAQSGFTRLELLRTQPNGAGWRDGGRQLFGAMPPEVPYVHCQQRQLIATDLEDVRLIEGDDVALALNNWPVRNGAYDMLNALSRGKRQRTPMSGVDAIFQTLARRVLQFYVAMNEYNARNWYSGLRLSEQDTVRMYDDASETPMITTMHSKTILFLLKSLSDKSVGPRRSAYPVQLNAECGLMRDCIETGARVRLFNTLALRYEMNANLYTAGERARMLHPRSGPLATFFETLRVSGMTRDIGPFYECAEGTVMYGIYMDVVDMIAENPLEFGVLPRHVLRASVPVRRADRLRALAASSQPYTNEYSEEVARLSPFNDVPRNRSIGPAALERMINDYDALERIREFSLEGGLTIELPMPLTIEIGTFPGPSSSALEIDYTEINHNRNMRRILKIKGVPLHIVAIEVEKLRRPDLYLKGFSPCENIFVSPEDARHVLIRGSDWLGTLGNEAHRSVAVRTNLVQFISLFHRV